MINQGLLATVKVKSYTKDDGTVVKAHLRNLEKLTDENIKKKKIDKKAVYADFEGGRTRDQVIKDAGEPIDTEILFDKKRVTTPFEIRFELESKGKRKIQLEFEKKASKSIDIDDIEIIQPYVFTNYVEKSTDKDIFAMKFKDKYYVIDGNHSLASQFLKGNKKIKARVINVK